MKKILEDEHSDWCTSCKYNFALNTHQYTCKAMKLKSKSTERYFFVFLHSIHFPVNCFIMRSAKSTCWMESQWNEYLCSCKPSYAKKNTQQQQYQTNIRFAEKERKNNKNHYKNVSFAWLHFVSVFLCIIFINTNETSKQ